MLCLYSGTVKLKFQEIVTSQYHSMVSVGAYNNCGSYRVTHRVPSQTFQEAALGKEES